MSERASHVTDESAPGGDAAGAFVAIAWASAEPGEVVSAHAFELGETAPEWVHVLPMGTHRGRDGRGPYTLKDRAHAELVIAATLAHQRGADPAIDYDHQVLFARENGKPAPASGWFKQFEVRDDGIWGRSDWTARAAQMIAAKEYRYFSPVFTHDQGGNVLRIVGGGLTNVPNLELTALASQATTGEPMNFLAALRQALGLAADADEAAVLAFASSLFSSVKAAIKALGLPETTTPDQLTAAASAAVATLAQALKLEGATTIPALAAAAQNLAAQAGAQPDPAKFVPIETHLAVASQLADLQGKAAAGEAERAVEDAVKAGKVAPATKDWAMAYAKSDLPGFQAYVKKAPVIVAPVTTAQSAGAGANPPPAGAQQLSADDLAVCAQLGVSAEEFAKNKEAR